MVDSARSEAMIDMEVHRRVGYHIEQHTLCFSLSSLLRGALIITRRTLDGALK